MPLGDFEREILRLLAANRNPDSFVGGATVLHQSSGSPRSSRDVDLFHDTVESLGQSSERDLATLRSAGYKVSLQQPRETFVRPVSQYSRSPSLPRSSFSRLREACPPLRQCQRRLALHCTKLTCAPPIAVVF